MFYKIIPYFILLFLLIITSLIIYILVNIKEAKDTKEVTDPVQNNKICLSTNDYNILLDKANHNKNNTTNKNDTNDTVVRDRKVLNDPLYPPLNRSLTLVGTLH